MLSISDSQLKNLKDEKRKTDMHDFLCFSVKTYFWGDLCEILPKTGAQLSYTRHRRAEVALSRLTDDLWKP